MKKLSFLLLLCAAAFTSFAQAAHPQQSATAVNPRLDKQEKDGFTVILKPAVRNTFLFSIYQKEKLLHTLMRHPVSRSAAGFDNRDAAFRAAGWMIGAYRQTGVFPETIPSGAAQALQLLPHARQQ